ncbi:MAG: hypothetical protein SP1CHLAM9_10830 [Chlamydiia bacterium]|nr:hypothetical protein [Chlamydiia bacterium]
MDNGEKMRMCPHCEGTVPLDSSSCRFCGSSFDEGETRLKGAFRDPREDSYYNPPYAPAADVTADSVYYPENNEPMQNAAYSDDQDTDEEEEKGHIVALALLSAGAMFFTLSLLLFFFSEHGRLILEWKSRYWSLYMIIGAPLLYYGFKKLRKL